jgi:hypothetical protein
MLGSASLEELGSAGFPHITYTNKACDDALPECETIFNLNHLMNYLL